MVMAIFSAAQTPSSKTSMLLKVDHATVCSSELDPMRQAFASVGPVTDYGGPHASVTHMALLGFEDGSYLELIAPQRPGVTAGSNWAKFMAGDAGACAWAVGSQEISADVERLKKAGVGADGPFAGSRKKPDGTLIEWETAGVGTGTPGATLPFMIQDKTPRNLRVQPSASVKGSGLTGISIVVLGVKDLDAAVALFRKAYGWPAPSIEEHNEFGAKMAYFSGTPVVLATPFNKDSWLTRRLQDFGESPVAYLLGTTDLGAATKRYSLIAQTQWFGKKLAWFDARKLKGVRLAVIAP
ncbi:MAG: VOC family protein [Acidobacteriia bacterium]|nr:VOC family protein [Terriglobia bacterium]